MSKHYEELHANSTEWAISENKSFRQHYQLKYEIELIEQGYTAEQARREFDAANWPQLLVVRYQNELDSSNSNGNRVSNTRIYGSGRR